ncbi:MAG TPA: TonB-dependent receptor [Kofleriaceae bacterium]
MPAIGLAQSPTTGAVTGRVTDEKGHAVPNVTIWATSPMTSEPAAAVSDDEGNYKITELVPGDYTVTFYTDTLALEHPDVHVAPNDVVSVFQKVPSEKPKGATKPGKGGIETVEIHAPPPQIRLDDPTKDYRYDRDFITKIPLPDNTFTGAAGTVPGAANDGVGIAFSGSTALENRYLIDGIDITGLTYGDVGTPLLSEFIQEEEIITGGYNAEWGRSTGGIVNAITKSGTNQFHGSVFGTFAPGAFTAPVHTTPVNASSIDVVGNKAYTADFGVDISGPIIKNHLWFYAGISPQFARTDYTRTTKSLTDCRVVQADGTLSICDPRLISQGGHADSFPDIDPKTGFYLTDQLDKDVRPATQHTYTALAKLNAAVNPREQGQLSFIVSPSQSRTPGLYGLASSGARADNITYDGAARWSSKLDQGTTEIEGVVAWHRSTLKTGSIDPSLDSQPLQILEDGDLGTWSALGGESSATALGCSDNSTSDRYTHITNCPMTSRTYAIGGPGTLQHDSENRLVGRLSILRRARFLGTHELKAGVDFEDDTKSAARLYSGGAFIQNDVQGQAIVTRWVQLGADDTTDPTYDHTCSDTTIGTGNMHPTHACRYVSGVYGDPGTVVGGETLNWSAYARDSWQLEPGLTLDLGMRYEEQRLLYASALRNSTDPLTGDHLGTVAMSLTNNWAPRLGVVWDPTHEGRSKLYASWGRFYESIPMDINDRSFGAEVSDQQIFNTTQGNPFPCGNIDPKLGGPNGLGCLNPMSSATQETLTGSRGVLIAPGIKAEYLDELLLGAELQIAPDLKIGASFQHRVLGRVIEDVSTDGAATYVLANPGEWSASEQHKLESEIAATSDPMTAQRLKNQLALYEGIRIFDKPSRDYNALELTVSQRLSRGLFLQASYTYARTQGNYPGSVSYDNGQIDPNISSQYDLVELLANRKGPLPQDRPHSLKIDGYYNFELGKNQTLTLGGRVRVVSGAPINALGSHYHYGADESFLLPRGTLGRSDVEHGIDLQLSYGHRFHKIVAEIYASCFNVYDRQGTFAVDETYAPQFRPVGDSMSGGANNANPVSGGSYADLIWVKTINSSGQETNVPIARNPNFGHPISRYAPLSAQLGARITF